MKNKFSCTRLLIIVFVLTPAMMLYNSCSSIDYTSYAGSPNEEKDQPTNEFSLITYNIKAIYDKEEEQMDSLIKHVHDEKYDFVIFQELFDESMRDYVIENSDTNKFTTVISRVDYLSFPEFIFQDAGLFMMSRYPRVDLSDIEFDDSTKNSSGIIHMILDKEMSRTNDFLANKSVMGALFELNDTTSLFLFTTHVQALGEMDHKLYQFEEINNFINHAVDSVISSGVAGSSENLIVILAGDFNSDAYDESRVRSMMDKLNHPRDLHKEFNGNKQEATWRFQSGNRGRRFDYIMTYDQIGDNILRKIDAKSINAVDILDKNGESISDHRALRAKISYK
jgi:endonuclease/exonuclease/phosphatase family metal-dependent hydrolase